MKKLVFGLLSLVLCFCAIMPVHAAPEDEFTASVSGGGAPGIVALEGEGNDAVIGYVVDTSGSKLATVYRGCIYVISLEDAQDPESKIGDYTRNQIITLYNQFINNEIKLSEELPELNELVAEKFGKLNNADNMVVRDLMLVDTIHDECKRELEKEGTTIDLTFEVNVEKGTFLQVATFIDGKWELVEKVVNNNEDDILENDGTVTVTFEDLCPVVFLVPGTMNSAPTFNWIYLLILLVLFIIFLIYKKRKKEQEA